MAKPKSPLLSFGARGTIADSVTFQKRGRGHFVRQKPIPSYRYTLLQAYQRWDYRDYAYLWTLLTDSDKQLYRTKASKYHITGFSQWMRDNLNTLPNLAGRWHLDHLLNATTPDSSKHANPGTVFGALIVPGTISNALKLDGTDDYIRVPHIPAYQLTEWTIEVFITPHALPGTQSVICKGHHATDFRNYEIQFYYAQIIGVYEDAAGADAVQVMWSPAVIGTQYHIAFTYKDRLSRLYINGDLKDEKAQVRDPKTTQTTDLFIGTRPDGSGDLNATMDNPTIYNQRLDSTLIKRHSERRYPP